MWEIANRLILNCRWVSRGTAWSIVTFYEGHQKEKAASSPDRCNSHFPLRVNKESMTCPLFSVSWNNGKHVPKDTCKHCHLFLGGVLISHTWMRQGKEIKDLYVKEKGQKREREWESHLDINLHVWKKNNTVVLRDVMGWFTTWIYAEDLRLHYFPFPPRS